MKFPKVRIIDYGKNAVLPAMVAADAERVLRASIGKQIRVVFTDGLAESIEVEWVDEEGCGYCGPDPATYARNFELVRPSPVCYWTPFRAIASIEPGT